MLNVLSFRLKVMFMLCCRLLSVQWVVSFQAYIPQSENANHRLSPQQVNLFTDGNILKYCKNYQNVTVTQSERMLVGRRLLRLAEAGLPQSRPCGPL